ncbi:MAG TPA: hypothetical protein VFA77_12410, partial [Candidatus Eisenbacteria bacterium]|nr:hypothetical protein [Candidatus Eisenbacteria bacterium]
IAKLIGMPSRDEKRVIGFAGFRAAPQAGHTATLSVNSWPQFSQLIEGILDLVASLFDQTTAGVQ